MKRPQSHWWRLLTPGEKLQDGDQMYFRDQCAWKTFYSFDLLSHAPVNPLSRRRVARPMHASTMREIIDNSPILHKKVIT